MSAALVQPLTKHLAEQILAAGQPPSKWHINTVGNLTVEQRYELFDFVRRADPELNETLEGEVEETRRPMKPQRARTPEALAAEILAIKPDIASNHVVWTAELNLDDRLRVYDLVRGADRQFSLKFVDAVDDERIVTLSKEELTFEDVLLLYRRNGLCWDTYQCYMKLEPAHRTELLLELGEEGHALDRAAFHWWVEDSREERWTQQRKASQAKSAERGDEPHLYDHILSGAEIARIPPPDPLIDGYLDFNTLALLYGAYGTFKSFLAAWWALCTATGTPWCGREVRKGKVLYIVAEGAPGMAQRYRAWCHHHLKDIDANVHNLLWLPFPAQLTNEETVEQLTDLVIYEHPSLVVVDTFARTAVGLKENDAESMGLFVESLDKVRREAAQHAEIAPCILTVHHAGKDSSRGARGNTALPAATSALFEMTKAETGEVVLRCERQKDREASPKLTFRPVPVAGSIVLEPLGLDPGREAAKPAHRYEVLDANILHRLVKLDAGEGVPTSRWEDAVMSTGLCGRSMFHERRAELIRRGYVHKVDPTKRAPYVLTEQGQRFLDEQTSTKSTNVHETSVDVSDGPGEMSVRTPLSRGADIPDIWSTNGQPAPEEGRGE